MKKKRIFIFTIVLTVLGFCMIWFSRPVPSPLNVILISIDKLRADRLGCYGCERDISPHMDELAEESLLFEKNFAPSSATTPSHVSMFTSLYPLSHGVLSNRDPRAFSDDIVSIAQVLKDKGFMTAGFVGGGNVSELKGFRRGFNFWSEDHNIAAHLPELKDWLIKVRNSSFFLFFHFYDVHDPYIFRDDFREVYQEPDYYGELVSKAKSFFDNVTVSLNYYNRLTASEKIDSFVYHMLEKPKIKFEKGVRDVVNREILSLLKDWPTFPDYQKQLQLMIDSYDAGIMYTDAHMGRLFKSLKSQDLWENTLIVVTSDHGEEFMEHNQVGHLFTLYDTLLHVPLIIKMPESSGISAKRISSLSEITDIMPTILDVFGIPLRAKCKGGVFCL